MKNKIFKTAILLVFISFALFSVKGFLSGEFGIIERLFLLFLYAIFIYQLNLKQFIYLILFLYFIYPFCQRYFGFPSLPPLTKTMIIFIEYLLVRFIKKNQIKIPKINLLEIFAIILILVVIFSSFINLNSPFLTIKSLLTYFLPFLLLGILISRSRMDEQAQKKILKLILILLIIQIPVSFVQGMLRSGSPDGNNGTIVSTEQGGTGTLAILMTIPFIYFYIRSLNEGFRIKLIIMMLLSPVPIIVGSGRFGIVLLIIGLIISPFVVFFIKRKKGFLKLVITITLSFALITFIVVGLKDYIPRVNIKGWDVAYSLLTQKQSILEYGGYYERKGRLGDYVYISAMHNDLGGKLFGFGGGSIISSQTIQELGSMRNNITSYTFGVVIFTSLGFVGILFIILFLFILQFYIRKYIDTEKEKYFIYWSSVLIIFLFLIPFSALYTRLWDNQVGLVLFIITGVLINRYHTLKRKSICENS